MDMPTLDEPRLVAPDTHALTTYIPVPGMGVLPVNAYVIRAAQPVLVDTGIPALGAELVETVSAVVPLEELRWIWLTHTDPDHVGALAALLEQAPQAQVVTTFLGMGKLGMMGALPPERAYLLNPGQVLDVGDRSLAAIKPPSFDAPETTALFDTRTRAFFSSDCFGALMGEPREAAEAIAPKALEEGLCTWTTVDAPWIHAVDAGAFVAALDRVRRLDANVVLGSHLPPARGITDALLAGLAKARAAAPFVGPDQAQLLQMAHAAA
jgi:flavorubredoxin